MNAADMEDVGRVFVTALTHVLANTLGETNAKVKSWLTTIVLTRRPWMMVTAEGVEAMEAEAFADAEIQTFVLEIQYTFGVYWGGNAADYKALAGVLGEAAGVQVDSAVGHEVKTRTSSGIEASTRLERNRWLMMLLLAISYVEPADEAPKQRHADGAA